MASDTGSVDQPRGSVYSDGRGSASVLKQKVQRIKAEELASTKPKKKEKAPSQAKSKRKTTKSPNRGGSEEEVVSVDHIGEWRYNLIISSIFKCEIIQI